MTINKRKNTEKAKKSEKFVNYEYVKECFKDFMSALAWGSSEYAKGYTLMEIQEQVDNYCRYNNERMINAALMDITKFKKSLGRRYELNCYEINDNGDAIENTSMYYTNDDLNVVLSRAAGFYRFAKRPKVTIFDYETNEYIAKWC